MENIFKAHLAQITQKLTALQLIANGVNSIKYSGRVTSAVGVVITGVLPQANIGELCFISDSQSGFESLAEIIAIDGDVVKLLPFTSLDKLSNKAVIYRVAANFMLKVGDFLSGKIVDGLGKVVQSIAVIEEAKDDASYESSYPIMALAPNPLTRKIITEPLYTGVKVLDLFITCGKGQRLAIFAGPGMGKTTLIGMIVKSVKADIIVIALIGERGREVREFIDLELDEEARKKCVLVVVTSDRPPVEQVKAAYTAHTIAEYFRDQGLDVLLFMDSITRFARAQREVGLSAGEPITRGGFPPSVFLSFPKLMERAGNAEHGSITAFYTVLMEGEHTNQDPVADEVRSIVDGHIILSRKMVEQGHFPAVNPLTSLSRVADRIIESKHQQAARKIRLLLSKYEELEFLIRVGEYKRGNDLIADEACDKYEKIMSFLTQGVHEVCDFNSELNQLIKLAS